ncbi:MAG: tRNA (adenosine(37)-N6)-threonylcarbamoyltransferase complex dimerization subunit type 1 TsaB [Alphaproteobacteria bacterium]|nr:MAG: tRNA (adenosine(37)-N6)-threonylcarbamoyltransferase complex dimerization subunit type 1 TsaB [Alphaproteobacteria bacterium]TAF15497.1 MAG: tRNA (adenosine(37)-N6)-threonylcarbamoyltransferase complex dimerization subunit type 1 TsaB [Alphaproteobacteria bacterium]TAF40948.1 MAG: tRNA (adenosine(37)-N6)-threonylcarbamoyltransferase complex dimerization subunit type 1 TsaB [Alphaproteobacteria bacterium]
MTYLVIDTSQGITSLALIIGGTVRVLWNDDTPNQQSAQLVMQCDSLMQDHGVVWSDLHGIVCTTGPGGFTSVRIAIAAVRGFALAANVASHGVSVMEVMAWSAMQRSASERVCVVVPAGRSECAYQFFEMREARICAVSHLMLSKKEELSHKVASYPVCVPEAFDGEGACAVRIDMRTLAHLLADYVLSAGWNGADYPAPVPLYARPPDAAIAAPLLKHG